MAITVLDFTNETVTAIQQIVKTSVKSRSTSIDGVAKTLILIGVVGFVGNILAGTTLLLAKKLRGKYFNIILISQCLIDAITSLLVIAFYSRKWNSSGHYGVAGKFYCTFWYGATLLWTFITCSTINLIVLILEHFLGVCFPIVHKTRLKVSTLKFDFCQTWYLLWQNLEPLLNELIER